MALGIDFCIFFGSCSDGRIKVFGGDNIEGIMISPKQTSFKNLEVCNSGFMLILDLKCNVYQSFSLILIVSLLTIFVYSLTVCVFVVHVCVVICVCGNVCVSNNTHLLNCRCQIEMLLKNFIYVSYLFTSFSQFLENQGFLASVSSDNEIQVLYKTIKVLPYFL